MWSPKPTIHFALLALAGTACASSPDGGATGGASGAAGASVAGDSGSNGAGASGSNGVGGVPPASGASGNAGTLGGASFGGSPPAGAGGASPIGGSPAMGGASGGSPGVAGASGGAAGAPAMRPYKGVANSECADLTRLTATWWYNWTTSPGNCRTGEFVPMVSGKNEKEPAAVSDAVRQIAAAGFRNVLGFNEPNKADQANLSVDQVVSLWPALTSNAALQVGSPATSADAQAWFNDFMARVTAQALRTEFVAIHWYGWNAGSCDANAATLESYIRWAEGVAGDRPIWITEWGCMHESNPDAATVEAFFSGALRMLARHPRVERYAWYPWLPHNELVASDGSLTSLGTLFANAPGFR